MSIEIYHSIADWRDIFDFDSMIDTIDEEFEIPLAINHYGNGLVGFQFIQMTTNIILYLLSILEKGA